MRRNFDVGSLTVANQPIVAVLAEAVASVGANAGVGQLAAVDGPVGDRGDATASEGDSLTGAGVWTLLKVARTMSILKTKILNVETSTT